MLSKYFCSSSSSLCFNRRHLIGSLLLHRPATTESNSSPPPQPHFMVDFLITNCGFSSDKATKVTSKRLAHLKSPDKPNSFVAFMRHHGFNDAQINKIVSSSTQFLHSDVDKTLAPKLKSLQDLGFSKSDIVHLIHSNPSVLRSDFQGSVLPKLQFWESLLGSRDNLMSLFKRNHGWFLFSDTEKRVNPNITLLRDNGISHESIVHVLMRNPAFICIRSTEEMAAAIEYVEKNLGVPRQSGMFLWVLNSFLSTKKSTFDAKLKLMKSLGWSEAEFLSAFCKAPSFITASQEILSAKMRFFVNEFGCEPSVVAEHPVLLMYSLERRLMPRHSVMKFLKSRGLIRRECKLGTIMDLSKKLFMERYVVPHKENHPELLEMYVAGCDSRDSL